MLSKDDIRRVLLGHYTRPAGDPLAGRRIVVGAYLVPHPDGLLLFDSGFGAAAHEPGYTVPALVDFPGAAYQVLDGEAEILPGVRMVPTPGHTDGHQSLVVDCAEGPVVLLGQAYEFASDWARAAFAWSLAGDGVEAPLDDTPPWVGRLRALDPCRVLLAHDLASVEARGQAG
jgi:N-acyl homoserine lactone hydrolase